MRKKEDHMQNAFAQIGHRLREDFAADMAPLPQRLLDLVRQIEQQDVADERDAEHASH